MVTFANPRTTRAWSLNNPVLPAGTACYESDKGCGVKVGNGMSRWRDLPYVGSLPRT